MATSDHFKPTADEEELRDASAGCPECGGGLRMNSIETVCEDCGLIVAEHRIDHGPEWRTLADDGSNRPRTGAPLTPARHDRGLSTELWGGIDANGNAVSSRKRRQLGRLKREHARGRWRSKAERNLAHGLSETRRVVSALALPQSIRDQACALFRSAANEGLLPGRSIEAIAAASVYAACRCNGLPRSFDEVAVLASVDSGRVENAYRVMNRELGIPTTPPSPVEFIPRIVSELGISDGTRNRAERLAKQAIDEGVGNGCHPGGVAAGCVYAAARSRCERVTQADVADCAGVSDATVRARWEELRPLVSDAGW